MTKREKLIKQVELTGRWADTGGEICIEDIPINDLPLASDMRWNILIAIILGVFEPYNNISLKMNRYSNLKYIQKSIHSFISAMSNSPSYGFRYTLGEIKTAMIYCGFNSDDISFNKYCHFNIKESALNKVENIAEYIFTINSMELNKAYERACKQLIKHVKGGTHD